MASPGDGLDTAAADFVLASSVNSANAAILFYGIFYGTFLLSFLLGFFTVLQRTTPRKKETWVMVTAALVLLVLATATTLLSHVRRSLGIIYVVTPLLEFGVKPAVQAPYSLTVAAIATGRLMMWIGDCVILWRAFMLCEGAPTARKTLLTLQLVALLFLVLKVGLTTNAKIAADVSGIIFLALLCTTNFLATFTLVKKWRHYQRAGDVKSSMASGALDILVECGVLYAIIQLIILWFAVIEMVIPLFDDGTISQTSQDLLSISQAIMICGELISGILSNLSLSLIAIKYNVHGGDQTGSPVVSTILFQRGILSPKGRDIEKGAWPVKSKI